MAQVSCYFSKSHHIIACSHPLSHLHFLLTKTIHMIKDDQIGWTWHHHHFAYTPLIQQQPHWNPIPYLKPGHSLQVYSNQKEIVSNIKLLLLNPPSPFTLYGPLPPRFARFCDTRTCTKNCPMFPCSHRFSLFAPLLINLLTTYKRPQFQTR